MTNNYLPPEWQDEERIRVLMGPMPASKEIVSYNSRITFWSAALFNWCNVKNTLTFTLYDCEMAFRRGTQTPSCLLQVLEHLIKKGDIISVEDLMKSQDEKESWVAWSKKIVITPSKWAWKMIQNSIGWKEIHNTVFIYRKILEEKSEELLKVYWRMSQNNPDYNPKDIITVEELYRIVSTTLLLSLEDLNLVLHCLAKKKRIAILEHHGKSLVKLAKPGQTEPLIINDIEIAEHELSVTKEILAKRIDIMQRESAMLRDEAKKFLMSGHKNKAMSLLRRKRSCEKSIETTLISLENVSLCLQQIQDSKLNTKILKTFQLGANALKSSIAASGGLDGVSKEMESLQEVLDECKDITDTLAFGIQSPENIEEADLEHELEELMVDTSVTHTKNTTPTTNYDGLFLPDVPTSDPLKKYEREMLMS